jgi:hypothetical protein
VEIIAAHTTPDGSLIRIVMHFLDQYEIQVSHVHPYLVTFDFAKTEAEARKIANRLWTRLTEGDTMLQMKSS